MFRQKQTLILSFFILCAFLSGCQQVPLADTPYQRIVKKTPQKSQFLVRIKTRIDPALNQASAPISRMPGDNEIRRILCESLANTRFQCILDEKSNLRPDFIVYVEYGAIRDPTIREQVRLSRRGLRWGIFGDHDPGGEEVHLFLFRYKIEKPNGEKVYQSQTFSEQFDFWEFNLKDYFRRYFSS
jgi:hypothetical protein